MKKICIVVFVLLLGSCAKHGATPAFEPITSFSGRILVFDVSHRYQLELDWLANEERGHLRLTHALSGRVMFVQWKGQEMFWRDNAQQLNWQTLTLQQLTDMGVILPPWTLAKVFLGQYPSTMRTKDDLIWKGTWNDSKLQIKWSKSYQRVELTDFQNGRKATVIIHE